MGVLDLAGRVALVAGAGQGIGEATAVLLARAGARVAIVDRHRDRAERVASVLAALGGEAIPVVADVSRRAEVERALAEAERGLGPLDIVTSIVGSASWGEILALDDEVWQRDWQQNLQHHVLLSGAAARGWIGAGRQGTYCAVASISGLFSSARHAAYGAAKAALVSFVRSAAEEWWPHGIRINAVAPGAVRTPRIEAMMRASDSPPAPEQLARMALPEDVGGAIVFLVSDLARRITGQVVVVDGGTTTRFPYGAR